MRIFEIFDSLVTHFILSLEQIFIRARDLETLFQNPEIKPEARSIGPKLLVVLGTSRTTF